MAQKEDQPSLNRRAIREQIDENLKRVYTATLTEELPDRFRDLLDQLKARGTPGSDGEQ